MPTDTSERGLERLICTALTGSPCEPGAGPAEAVHERPAAYGVGWICGEPEDYDREYCVDLVQLCGLPAGDAAGGGRRRSTSARTARRGASSWPGCRARSRKRGVDRRAAQGRQARAAPPRPVLRHAVAGQRQGRRSATRRTASASRASSLQPGRDAARARPVPVHQRPADRHLRAEEQPHQADGRGRRRAVQARPRPARAALRVRPLRGALRRGRQRGADVHRSSRARARGSCRSTRAGTTARAIRRTRTASRPTTSGSEVLTPRRA